MKKYLLFLAFFAQNAAAQDTHFTQSYAVPTHLNPAMVGAFDGRYRLSAAYRNQWSSFLSTPFQGISAAFDMRMPIGKEQQESFLGVGIDLYSDKLGGTSYASTNSMALTAAYHKPLDMWGNSYISAGLRVAFAQRSIDYEGLTFQDQFNGLDGYTLPTGENLNRNVINYTDLATGVYWSTNVERRNQFHVGVGLFHFNAPNVALFTNEAKPLGLRTSITVGGQLELSPRVDIIPRLIITTQAGHFESNLGANFRIGLDDYNDASLFLGGWARPVHDTNTGLAIDAVVLMTGLQFGQLRIGASYDANISPLITSTNSVGAMELTVQYIGNYGGEKVICPTF
ncbi:MAG: hypothetical protein RI894_1642 [Bacteroidota bacterium]|jgi:type IX secretion system PorP/SprF family membrane protein